MKKVKPGESLNIPASAYNAFVDAAIANQNRINQTTQNKFIGNKNLILIKNNTGGVLSRLDVVGIGEPLYDPAIQPLDFTDDIIFLGEAPDFDDHVGKWAIVLDGCGDGELVRAINNGNVGCKIYAPDEDSLDLQYADLALDDEDNTVLQPVASGSAQILWVDDYSNRDDNDYVWAMLRLGTLASGGCGETLMYQATSNQTGGSGAATVTAKRVAADGTLAETEETLDCYDDAPPIISGDYLVTTQDKDGNTVAVAAFGTLDPTALSGTGATASTSTWNTESQSDSGVQVTYVTRTYWSGTAEDPIYYFTRTMKYDSRGCLREVSAETRYELGDTKVCS